ncbi:MAG: hypothetical protein AAED33_00330 [Paracoccaceae bacterium]
MNGIAKFLGQPEKLKSVKEIIRRQNPGSLRGNVENYDEMQAALAVRRDKDTAPKGSIDPLRRTNIPKMVSCINQPILFVPIPGGPNDEILRWMNALDQGTPMQSGYGEAVANGIILHSGHNQRTLFEWIAATSNMTALTAVRHPLPRAYDAFMSKIFASDENSYGVIREQLVNNFGVALPESEVMEDASRKSLEKSGYGIGQHRAAFHAFFRFLKDNLSGQTSIRKDGLWDSQLTFLTGFNAAVPIGVIAQEGQMDAALRYIETLLDLPAPQIGARLQPDHIFTLDEICSRQTENLARKAYSSDYARFGFTDYQAALEV